MEVASALYALLNSEAWTKSSLVDVRHGLVLLHTRNPEVYRATRAFAHSVQGFDCDTKYDRAVRDYIDEHFKSYRVARRRALSAALMSVSKPLKVLYFLYDRG